MRLEIRLIIFPVITKFKIFFTEMLEDKNFGIILKGGMVSFIAKLVAVPISLLTSFILAKYYGAETVGDLALITSFLTISSLFVTIGLDSSLIRFIPEQLSKHGFFGVRVIFLNAVKIVILTGFLVTLICLYSVSLLATQLFKNINLEQWLYVATFLIVIVSLSNISTAVVRSLQRVELLSILQLLQPFLWLTFLVVMTRWFYSVDGPFYTYFLSLTIAAMASTVVVFKLFGYKKNLKKQADHVMYSPSEMLEISWPMFLIGGMGLVISQTDILMLGAMTKSEDVGVYAIVMKLGLAVNFILTSINMVLGPKFAELYYRGDMEGLVSVAKKSSKLIFYCTAPFLLVLVVLGKPILGFFGEEFISGYTTLCFIALGQFINAICGSVGYFMNMTGNQKLFCRIIFSAALLNIVLNLLLIPLYGITGAAIASLLSVCLWNIVTLVFIKNKFGFYMGYLPFAERGLVVKN
jgi:O-antigen/teichoic acid export membrane protein